jgi:hypothetical protein
MQSEINHFSVVKKACFNRYLYGIIKGIFDKLAPNDAKGGESNGRQ